MASLPAIWYITALAMLPLSYLPGVGPPLWPWAGGPRPGGAVALRAAPAAGPCGWLAVRLGDAVGASSISYTTET
jgi:hypothetical protein